VKLPNNPLPTKQETTSPIIPIEVSKQAWDLGFTPIPIGYSHDKDKIKFPSHKHITTRPDPFAVIEKLYKEIGEGKDRRKVTGAALKLIDDLFMFDVDLKYTTDKLISDRVFDNVNLIWPEILDSCCIEKSRNDGRHWYFKKPGVTKKPLVKNKNFAELIDGNVAIKEKEVVALYANHLSFCYPTPGCELLHGGFDTIKDITQEQFEFVCQQFIDEGARHPDHVVIFDRGATTEDIDDDLSEIEKVPDQDIKDAVKRIADAGIDLTADRNDWINWGYVFRNEYGEGGEELYQQICSNYPGYNPDECHDKFSELLRSGERKNGRKRTIASFWEVYNKHFKKEKNQLLQYCGVYSNNFKAGNVELSTGRLRDEAIEMGYCRYGGSYVKNSFGVLKKVEKENVYADLIKLCAGNKITFEVKSKSGTKLKFSVDKDQLITIAQKTLKGNLSPLAIPEFAGTIAKDTTKEVLLHFINKSIKISALSIDEVDKTSYCVWDEHIVKRDIFDEDIIEGSVFETFVRNISGEKNFEAFCTAIGYLLVNCNGSDGLKAAWLHDAGFEAGKLNGRTGKSLLIKGIGFLRKLNLNSGKDFDHVDKFKFQGLDLDIQIVVLDDVKENLNFPALFNFCTEGVEYEKKFAHKVKLSIQETPKLCISSNYPPPLEQGASVIGRLIVLPVLPYYASYAIKGGVKHVHGHTFFDDWDPQEWSRFFWFMINCAQTYLRKGLIHVNSGDSLKNRLKAICAAKLKDEDRAEHLVEWLYGQPHEIFKRFNLHEIKTKWAGNGFDSDSYTVDDQQFSNCLKVFFDIKGWTVKKTVERIDGSQKRFWNVTCYGV